MLTWMQTYRPQDLNIWGRIGIDSEIEVEHAQVLPLDLET